MAPLKLGFPIRTGNFTEIDLQSIETPQLPRARGGVEDITERRQHALPEAARERRLQRLARGPLPDGQLEDLSLDAMVVRLRHWQWR